MRPNNKELNVIVNLNLYRACLPKAFNVKNKKIIKTRVNSSHKVKKVVAVKVIFLSSHTQIGD